MSGSNRTKYERTKKSLAKSVLKVSLAILEGKMTLELANQVLESDARMVLRKHGRTYLLDAGAALAFKFDEVKVVDMETRRGVVKVPLYYEPMIQYIDSLR